MRKPLLPVGLLGFLGCWSSSSKPASPPQPVEAASTGGETYGEARSAGILGKLEGDTTGLFDEPDGSQNSMGAGGRGRYGTIGHGQVTGTGYGLSGGRVGAPPAVKIGDPSAQAGLDAAIIRRYVKRNLMKIQYCYEQELISKPQLAGTVHVRFTIGADGAVTQSTGHGMPPVDACVAGVIQRIQFPAPQGGGAVVVNYPFVFSAPAP